MAVFGRFIPFAPPSTSVTIAGPWMTHSYHIVYSPTISRISLLRIMDGVLAVASPHIIDLLHSIVLALVIHISKLIVLQLVTGRP